MQRVNEKDYCNLQCSRSKIIFCRKLTNMVDYKTPIIFKWTDKFYNVVIPDQDAVADKMNKLWD